MSAEDKRRVRYGVAMSLDGYIAGPHGEADWIVHDPDIDFTEIFSLFDTLLIGRKTFEAMSKMGGGGGSWGGVTSIVISRTPEAGGLPEGQDRCGCAGARDGTEGATRQGHLAVSAAASCSEACSRMGSSTVLMRRSSRCCSAAAFRCCRRQRCAPG